MKLLAVFAVILLAVLVSANMSVQEEKCMKDEGATTDDVTAFRGAQMPESRVQKCYYGCVMQAIGYLDPTGKRFSREGFLKAMLPAAAGDEQRQQRVRDLADKCDGVANEDRCELGEDVLACLKDRG